MSSEIAISVNGISKCYELYDSPQGRLKQFILPKINRLIGGDCPKYYREFWALKDIEFEVKKGESVGILGRNGSGKSTLLQIITGILSPTSGTISTNGRIAALLELGSGFNTEFTGRENVYLNGSLLGFSKEQIDQKFDRIAAFADIGQHIDQPVKTYSSGMLVRLAFAVQVQTEPDILIVDEALAVGDALFQKRCFQRIEKLLSDGVTLIFVSHDQESVRTLTHKALLLRNGKSVAWGISSDVVLEYRRQLHEEEAAYFAALTQQLTARSGKQTELVSESSESAREVTADVETEEEIIEPRITARSDKLSFGEGGVKVILTETLNADNHPCSIFYPGDAIKIRVVCESSIDTDKLNVAVRIRNKEGVKIYSWGTLNQDMQIIASSQNTPLFWRKQIKKNEQFEVIFNSDCALGLNLYEVQASVSHEGSPDYLNQYMLHWRDEAAFFQVLMKRQEYFFGGVIDMQMTADWCVINES